MDENGEPYALPAPNRHHHYIRQMAARGDDIPIRGEQGFLLEDGTFVRRKAAAAIARRTGQCTELMSPPWLFSEDLW